MIRRLRTAVSEIPFATLLLVCLAWLTGLAGCSGCHDGDGASGPRMLERRIPTGVTAPELRTEIDDNLTRRIQGLAQNETIAGLVHQALGDWSDQLSINRASATKLEIGPEQLPRLYRTVEAVARALEVKTPRTFLVQADAPNAYVTGVEHPILVIHSGLLGLLPPKERIFVLAHELGHLKAGHALPSQVVQGGLAVADLLPFDAARAVLSAGTLATFSRWSRAAEMTADRAGLLVVGDPDVCARALVRLVSGVPAGAGELNVDRFVAQRRELDEDTDLAERLPLLLDEARRDHPWAASRIVELRRYSHSPAYRALYQNHELKTVRIPLE